MEHSIFFSDLFEDNKRLLAKAMGYRPEEGPLLLILLKETASDEESDCRTLTTGPGRYVSLQLIHYLICVTMGIEPTARIPEPGHADVVEFDNKTACAFFAELWDAPAGQHPTVDWFREHPVFYLRGRVQSPEGGMEAALAQLQARPPSTKDESDAADRLLMDFLSCLTYGVFRSAEFGEGGQLIVHPWVKMGILLVFRLSKTGLLGEGVYDKLDSRFVGWRACDFQHAGIRVALGVTARMGSYVAPRVVLMMGAMLNIGAYVGEGTMIDGGARVGSCAVVGKNCHIGGGAGLGGVLEPPQAAPVMLEDDVFVGPNTEIAEGVIVRQGAVIAGGLNVNASIDILERLSNGEFTSRPRGEIPANAVVVGGSLEVGLFAGRKVMKNVLIIIKRRDPKTSAKVALEEALR